MCLHGQEKKADTLKIDELHVYVFSVIS